MIDVDKNETEVYRLKEDGKYQLEKNSPALPYNFNLDKDCSADVILNNIWE